MKKDPYCGSFFMCAARVRHSYALRRESNRSVGIPFRADVSAGRANELIVSETRQSSHESGRFSNLVTCVLTVRK